MANDQISQYGMIGDLQTAALIGEGGDLRWLCWPDFDSEACFASLVGDKENGVWSLAPVSPHSQKSRYVDGTMVLRTDHTGFLGAHAVVHDFMPVRNGASAVIRTVRGEKGKVRMQTRLAPRFDYGSAKPMIESQGQGCWCVIAGPHTITVRSNAPLKEHGCELRAEWLVEAGQFFWFTMQYTRSFGEPLPSILHPEQLRMETEAYWRAWAARNRYDGMHKGAVERSLLTLKALTYAPSGGLVAAPTTSLPEKIGGKRNWDYRFCWLRDTAFSLLGLLECGYQEEAQAWLKWLARSVQGNADGLKILYGVSGKREHSEWSAGWLGGYQSSLPVHIGNKASDQLQLGVYGEVLEVMYQARCRGIYPLDDASGQSLELPLLKHLETIWQKPDCSLWEFQSEPRQFTESKVMAWVAFDRGVRIAEQFGIEGPVKRWRAIRDHIHADVCRKGFHRGLNSFTQCYGSKDLDASLLLLPLVGFLPAQDARIVGTVKAVEKHLMRDGLLLRYDTRKVRDGLPPGEGAFLACSFWLVDVYVLLGRVNEAHALFHRLLALRGEAGLLSEEWSRPDGLLGNYPQAFSHIGLINAAQSLTLGTSTRLASLHS